MLYIVTKIITEGLNIISLLGIKKAKELENFKRQSQEEIDSLKTQLVREGIAKKQALIELEKLRKKLELRHQEITLNYFQSSQEMAQEDDWDR